MRPSIAAILVFFFTFLSGTAYSRGFGQGYTVWYGDIDGNSKTDLFVKAPAKKVALIPVDDFSIPIPISVPSFLLKNDGSGSFTIVKTLTPSEQSTVNSWPQADVDVFPHDIDLDGLRDLEIDGISAVSPDNVDLIVYADTAGGAPSKLTLKNKKFLKYHEQVLGWMYDHQYFVKNAPLKITSAEPAQRYWYGSIPDATNYYLMTKWIAECQAQYGSNYKCAISRSAPPPPCVRTGDASDSFGNPIGTTTENICQMPVHVLVYIPAQVTVSPDNSVFEPEATETAEILARLNVNCPAFPTTDEDRLRQIEELIYQHTVMGGVYSADTDNNFAHVPFPGDELFNTADKTFHHYDVYTKVCDVSQQNCTLPIIKDQVSPYFSYPARQLAPTLTQIPGPHVVAYITLPDLTSYPSAYIWEAGHINQRYVASGRWAGGTQNLTEADHKVYPGTISHYIEQNGSGIYVFTHGVGINRAGIFKPGCDLDPGSRPLQVLAARANDIEGEKAFAQLDKQLIKYWKRNFTSSPPPSGSNKPSVAVTGSGYIKAQ